MTRSRRMMGVSAVIGCAVAGLSACGATTDAASATHRTPVAGGTLQVLMGVEQLGATLDPAQSYGQSSENVSPLIMSALTAYVPEDKTPTVEGDLATNAGVATDGARVWTFHLKPGVEYSNGTPVTSYDVKYDVERSFASALPGGPPYLSMWLKGATSYKGPFSGQSLSSVQTPNASTIVFNLNQPVGDFNFLTTYPEFSGVPVSDKNAGPTYQFHMATSGPYKISSYVLNKSLVLVRNPTWKTSTDPSFKDYPDKIVFTEGLSPSVVDQRIIAAEGTDADAVPLDQPIQAADLASVLSNKTVRARTSIFSDGSGITYLGLNLKTKPFNNLLVRQAVEWAVNKQSAQTGLGGLYGAGPVANQILGPGVPGYESFNQYGGPTGNPAKAKQLLSQAGFPNGISTTLGIEDSPDYVAAAETIQTSLARAGIRVKIQEYSPSVYFTSIVGNPKSEPPIALSVWGADWNNASTIIPDLFDGSQLTPTGPNNNITSFDVPSLNQQMRNADGIVNLAQAAPLWAKLDKEIMAQAPVVPLIYSSKVYTVGSNIINGEVDPAFGTPNPMVMAVRSSK